MHRVPLRKPVRWQRAAAARRSPGHPRKAGARRTLGAVVVALVVAGCSGGDGVEDVSLTGDNPGYVAGDGTMEMVDADQRAAPIVWSGVTLEGEPYDVADQRGRVVVLNVWGSWCPPCVAETPDLQQVWSEMEAAGKPVAFLGLNYNEPAATGLAFKRANGVTYPSLSEPDGEFFPALQGRATTTPTTLVLDPQGRIAGRVNGQISAATLRGMIEEVLEEGGAGGGPGPGVENPGDEGSGDGGGSGRAPGDGGSGTSAP